MSLGKAIRLIRKHNKLTQVVLSQRIGISQNAYSFIEADKVKPHQSTLDKICKELHIPELVLRVISLQPSDCNVDQKTFEEEHWKLLLSACRLCDFKIDTIGYIHNKIKTNTTKQ